LLTEKYGITTQQWIILLLLAKDPNIIYIQEHPEKNNLQAKDLAEALNVSRANITNLLTILIQKNLVQQVSDGIDKRNKIITLTRQGEKVIDEMEVPRKKRNDYLFRNFSKEQKNSFIDFIQSSLHTLQEDMQKMHQQKL
jgi:DNA-binding MarR family transcriptional regulator